MCSNNISNRSSKKVQIIFFGEGEFIPKSRFDEVNNQVKDHKNQIAERDKQLEELKKFAKGNEELT